MSSRAAPPHALASVAVPPSLPRDTPGTVAIRLEFPDGRSLQHIFAASTPARTVAALAAQQSGETFRVDPDSGLPCLGLLLPPGRAPGPGVVLTAGGQSWLAPWSVTLGRAGLRRVKLRVVRLTPMDFDNTAAAAEVIP